MDDQQDANNDAIIAQNFDTPKLPEGPKPFNWFLYFAASTAHLSMFATGIAFGWTSPVLPKLNGRLDSWDNPIGRPITTSEESWITAFLPLGAMLGCFGSGYLADTLGRRKTYLLLACPMLVAFVMVAFARVVTLFYVAWFLMGIASGSVFTINPMYCGEIAEDHNRGTVSSLNGVFLTGGVLFSYLVGPFLSIRDFSLVCLVPVVLFFGLFLFLVPESPDFYALVDDEEGLKVSLSKLRQKASAELEEEALFLTKRVRERSSAKSGVMDLIKNKTTRRGFAIIIGLVILQQLSGISAVFAYLQTIFDTTGSKLAPETSTIIIGTIQVVTTMLTSSLVDKVGRRSLLMASSFGSFIALLALGAYFFITSWGTVESLFWLPVASLVVYIVTFNFGLGPLTWTVLSELFPTDVKAVASMMASLTRFFVSFLVLLFFPAFSLLLGPAVTFWFFAIVCFGGAVFVHLFLPETKGKSVEEILSLLEAKKG